MINIKSQYTILSIKMMNQIKIQNGHLEQTAIKTQTKKERCGRWTHAESNLFESLLQKYGKNWKRIHQHMKGRTLSQIRSHAQKLFDKIGAKKVEEFQRRAKLLDAFETLQKQKLLQEEALAKEHSGQLQTMIAEVKQQEQSHVTGEQVQMITQIKPRVQVGEFIKPSELIKEQIKQTQNIKELFAINYPTIFNPYSNEQGFLMNIIGSDIEAFQKYGFSYFIDATGFRSQMF